MGDVSQRWLTAFGPYQGDTADLVVYSSSGGLFHKADPEPYEEEVGVISLQFADCERGTLVYDLSSYGLSGEIPIQRVAPDNVASCEVQGWSAR